MSPTFARNFNPNGLLILRTLEILKNCRYRVLSLVIILLASILISNYASAARLDVDGFNPIIDNIVFAIVEQPNGASLIGGSFSNVNSLSRNGIVRLHVDGSVDINFNPGAGANGSILAIYLQDDGKILIGGNFTRYNGQQRNGIARLLEDGSLDTGFNPGSGAMDGVVLSIDQQADGKVIVGGSFTSFDATTRRRLVRLENNGSLDTSFSPSVTGDVYTVASLNDGRILVGGTFTGINGVGRNNLARLNADGTIDTSFVIGIGANNPVFSISERIDGKVLIGGDFSTFNGVARNRLALLDPDGRLNIGFNAGAGVNNSVRTIHQQADGKILIGGLFSSVGGFTSNNIARLNPNGSFDNSFSTGTGGNGTVFAISQQQDGNVVIGGSFTLIDNESREFLARIDSTGDLDAGFDVGSGADNLVQASFLQSDDRLLIGGNFTTVNGFTRSRIARLDADGSFDTNFNVSARVNGLVTKVIQQADGKILIAGQFTRVNGSSRVNTARLNSNGSLDTEFDTNFSSTAVVTIAPLSDGKLYVSSFSRNNQGATLSEIRRLTANGTPDPSFNANISGGSVLGILPLANGQVILVGSFTGVNNITQSGVARLNENGSVDTSFDPELGPPDSGSFISQIGAQRDGRIMIAGSFSMVDGLTRNNIARLQSNGDLDPTFNAGTAVNIPGNSGNISRIAIQANGKILVAGDFTIFDDESTVRHIIRLNPTGSIDQSFNNELGGNFKPAFGATEVLLQRDGKVILGESSSPGVRRLTTTEPALQNLSIDSDGRAINWFRSGANPTLLRTTFEFATSLDGDWLPLGNGEAFSAGWRLRGLNLLSESVGYIRARGYSANHSDAQKPVAESVRQFYLRPTVESESDTLCFPIKATNGNFIVICL